MSKTTISAVAGDLVLVGAKSYTIQSVGAAVVSNNVNTYLITLVGGNTFTVDADELILQEAPENAQLPRTWVFSGTETITFRDQL